MSRTIDPNASVDGAPAPERHQTIRSEWGRLRELAKLTETVGRAGALAEIYDAALDAIERLLGADRASILLFDADGKMRFKHWRGLSERYRRTVEGHSPWSRDTRDPDPVIVSDVLADESLCCFREVFEQERIGALTFVPLCYAGQLLGKLMLYFDAPRRFEVEEVQLAETVAGLVAFAVARKQIEESLQEALDHTEQLFGGERRARAAAEAAEARARFLADAGSALGSSLDYTTTLTSVAEAAVPRIADYCVIDLLDKDVLSVVAIVHSDPSKVAAARAIRERWPATTPAKVIASGRSVLVSELTDEMIAAHLTDPERLAAVRALAPRSVMVVPIATRDRVFGTFELASETSGCFQRADLEMAEELGRRAAVAIENARLYREATEAVKARDDFLSIAGHELRTPLTALGLQIAGLTRQCTVNETVSERVEKAARSWRRMSRLVEELLDVSRITAGRFVLETEEVDLVALTREVLGRSSEGLARAGCSVTFTAPDSITGHWDRLRIEQVVGNLLTNAMKYGPGKPIEVTVTKNRDSASLTVADHGIGIAPADQARIFDRFERAVNPRHFGGLGLGLWIVRQVVEAHGGRIFVNSATGAGASFHIELPTATH